MTGSVTIVSCGLGPQDLTARHRDAVHAADVLAGGTRLLDGFPDFGGETIPIGAHALDTVATLTAMAALKRVAVLASGDALFFGIARLFIDRMPPERLTILPNLTAAQAALARLRIPWQAARFFSVHGRAAALPWRAVLQAPLAVIYCDRLRNPARTAAELIAAHPPAASRPAALAEKLGACDERLRRGTLAELADDAGGGMSLLILLDDASDPTTKPALALGLDDEVYEHEAGLITHPELRAVVLSKLRLRPGVLWDLGAGSGSVSIEACGLCDGLRAWAVEAQPARCEQIRTNAARAGCTDYEVVQGALPEALERLPAPDAIFVGGGGAGIAPIVTRAYDALHPGGTLVAAAVLEETRAALVSVLPEHERQVVEIAVRRSAPVGRGTMLKPYNPVCLFVFRKETV